MSRSIIDSLNCCLKELITAKNVWVAYSGGVDSHVLLHALVAIRKIHPELVIRAIHIHHGLMTAAEEWVAHCEKICHDLAVSSQVIRVQIKRDTGESLEALARDARYGAFAEILAEGDILLTAHHRDDQAETCLLQFLRGSGPKGLAAMPVRVQFSKGHLIRPFLSVSRENILGYAEKHQLQWIEDDSNRDMQFTRNFLRYQVMPLLRARWPAINQTIARVSHNCSNADFLLQQLALQDLAFVKGPDEKTLSIEKMRALSPLRQKNVLRVWWHRLGFTLPSAIKLHHVMRDVIDSRIDACPCVCWKDVEIRRYRDRLYALSPIPPFDSTAYLSWDGVVPLMLPSKMGTLIARQVLGEGFRFSGQLTVRFRQGGEKCCLRGREGSHTLKKLFQEWGVPPWERNRTPLIFVNNELAVIFGHAICKDFIVQKDELGLVLKWSKGLA